MPIPVRYLPNSHWWTDDGRTLYHNWRWMASVGNGQVSIRSLTGKVEGRCGSDAHGRLHVERWLAAQTFPSRKSGCRRAGAWPSCNPTQAKDAPP